MTSLSLALAVAVLEALALVGMARAILNLERRNARRVDGLLDRIAHMSGKTWTPPPSDNGEPDLQPVVDSYDPFHEPDL